MRVKRRMADGETYYGHRHYDLVFCTKDKAHFRRLGPYGTVEECKQSLVVICRDIVRGKRKLFMEFNGGEARVQCEETGLIEYRRVIE
jgi:hypothetical protein